MLRPTCLDALFQPRAQASFRVTLTHNNYCRYWNFSQLSVAYACCLGLGPDLP